MAYSINYSNSNEEVWQWIGGSFGLEWSAQYQTKKCCGRAAQEESTSECVLYCDEASRKTPQSSYGQPGMSTIRRNFY